MIVISMRSTYIIDPAARSSSSFPAHDSRWRTRYQSDHCRYRRSLRQRLVRTCNVTQISRMTNACDALGIHRRICKLWIGSTGSDRRSRCMCSGTSGSSLRTASRSRCWSALRVAGCSIFFIASRIWVFTFFFRGIKDGLNFLAE